MPSEQEPRLEDGRVESAGTARNNIGFPLWAWVSVIGLAVVVRAVNFAFLCDHPLITHPQVDGAFYDLWARDAARGADLGTRMLWSAPLYPTFVTTIYRAFGSSVHAVMVVQHLVGVLATAVFVCLLLRLTSRRVAMVGGLVWAAYPLNAYYEAFLLPTSMIVGLGIVAALAVLNATHSAVSGNGLGKAWIAGLVWGMLALASDNYLYLSVLLLPLFWPRLRHFGAFLVGIVLVVAPIALRNYSLTGELIPISAHGGEAVYIANNPRTDGLFNPLYNGFQKLTGHEQQRQKASKMAGRELNYGEANRFWVRKTLEFIASQPLRYVRLLGSKLLLAVHRTELPNTEDYRYFRTQSPVLRFNPLHFGVLLPFGAVGLLVGWPARRRLGVLYVMLVVSAVPVAAVFATSRYRMPLMPFLTAFAVLGAFRLVALFRDRSRPTIGLALLTVFLGTLYIANRPWPRLDVKTDWSLVQMGRIALAERHPEAAIPPLEEARRLEPSDGTTRLLLARAYARAGRPTDAFQELQQAERVNPNKRAVWREMANLLIELGRCDAAVAPLERLLAANPKDTQAAAALAHCQAPNGQAH